jgi:hypothetical protein
VNESLPNIYNSELPPIENFEIIDNIDNPFVNINNNHNNNNNNNNNHNNNNNSSSNSLSNNNNVNNNNNISVNNVNITATNNTVNSDSNNTVDMTVDAQSDISPMNSKQSSASSSLESIHELVEDDLQSDSSLDEEDDLNVGDISRTYHSFQNKPSILERIKSEDINQKRRGSAPSVSRKTKLQSQPSPDLLLSKSFEYNAKGVKLYSEQKFEDADHYFSKAIAMKDHNQFYANRAAVKLKLKVNNINHNYYCYYFKFA